MTCGSTKSLADACLAMVEGDRWNVRTDLLSRHVDMSLFVAEVSIPMMVTHFHVSWCDHHRRCMVPMRAVHSSLVGNGMMHP